ncbi:hypothetical protein SAMN04490243_0758 [Robiginitalea myxolifaciens]|uniref:Uncharacterized protein n=1 Tax=Robiginitalea myxolifaciens TaxID=400055 RepID=A0A1I6FVI4_9FLAO|nr:DUF6660 family protein [Robiginitalea myxolifaciens]SFR33962.1 hypothetical protein SAMN04490243_0758 [Robiginitalea myxolifaciens]
MKFLAVILSFYFLALNFLPCSDDAPVNNFENTEVHVDFDHRQDHGNCELCSPFCHCHCCHSHTVDFGIFGFQPIDETISNRVFTYCEGFGINFSPSLLQPPKKTV